MKTLVCNLCLMLLFMTTSHAALLPTNRLLQYHLAPSPDHIVRVQAHFAHPIRFHIHPGQQGKHIPGHNNFEEGRSYLNVDVDPAELLSGVHSGKYPIVGTGTRGNPIVDFGRSIGIDGRTGQSVSRGQIHYGKSGAHIVPDARN